ncbi:MAG: hypothetical protein COV45_03260 [Deltaproteobacteria bacterium CG11_big_fil_rev_8_21_14_0_20_47_16]|nr:MAG: hypothetical protein COV45_03260 [Deltaproteobacteria bacterium CG11_big_fil_rev_8_21_14_0_20_47_16]
MGNVKVGIGVPQVTPPLQSLTPAQLGVFGQTQSNGTSVEKYLNIGELPSFNITLPENRLFSPLHNDYADVRVWLEDRRVLTDEIKKFLETHKKWFDESSATGDYSAGAAIGILKFKRMLLGFVESMNGIEAGVDSPIKRSAWWQDSKSLASFDEELRWVASYIPIITRLVTVSQNLRSLMAKDNVIKYATPLAQVVVDDFFIGIAAMNSQNESLNTRGASLLKGVAQHIQLLAQYDQVTQRYKKAVTQLKQYTSPLVGSDFPWLGHYAKEYPEIVDGFNPSTLPADHLNEQALQKSYSAIKDTSLVSEYDNVFRTLNHDDASVEHQKSELTANATWNRAEQKFEYWGGEPWKRLADITNRRASVVKRMEEMAQAAESYKSPSMTPEEGIAKMKKVIATSRDILQVMDKSFRGNWWILVPGVPEYSRILKPIMMQVDAAHSAILAADVAFKAGNNTEALKQLFSAQHSYITAVGTPRFQSLFTLAGKYQDIAFYNYMGAMVLVTAASAGIAGVVAGEVEAAMIAANYSTRAIQFGSLLANAATFTVSSNSLGNVWVDQEVPDGVGGWSYEVASNTVLFGALGKIALKYGRPMGEWTRGSLTGALGARAATWYGTRLVTLGSEAAQMLPTYTFFAGAWTPMDMMRQEFFADAPFNPLDTLEKAYSRQSLVKQLGFLVALRVGNEVLSKLPPLKNLESVVKVHLNEAIQKRFKYFDDQRLSLDIQEDVFRERWANDPIGSIEYGRALMAKRVAQCKEELDFLKLPLFDDQDVTVIQQSGELRTRAKEYADAEESLRDISQLVSAFKAANVHEIATELFVYNPEMQGLLQALSGIKRLFSLQDLGKGTFLFTWRGSDGESLSFILIPDTGVSLSGSTEIVLVK